ncbi:MAG: hypothetical protein U0835_16825 [Isosphaeraceae bacterium]
MSRAYCTGLMPRSLSRVRSQASRPIPATFWATLSISWLISAAVTSTFLALEGLLDELAGDERLEDFLALAGDALVGELGAG